MSKRKNPEDFLPMGRPTEYEPWMDDEIVKLSHSMFLIDIAVKWGVSFVTLNKWGQDKRKPNFVKSYTRAKDIILSRMYTDMYSMRNSRDGNYKCMEFLIDRFTDSQEKRALKIEGLSKGDMREKSEKVLAKVEDGQLRPDEFKTMMDGLRTVHDITVAQDNADALAELKAKNKL